MVDALSFAGDDHGATYNFVGILDYFENISFGGFGF
jgi:hypothetical protein